MSFFATKFVLEMFLKELFRSETWLENVEVRVDPLATTMSPTNQMVVHQMVKLINPFQTPLNLTQATPILK